MLVDGRALVQCPLPSAVIISEESLHLITPHACTAAKNVEDEYGAGSSRQQHVLLLVRFTGSVPYVMRVAATADLRDFARFTVQRVPSPPCMRLRAR